MTSVPAAPPVRGRLPRIDDLRELIQAGQSKFEIARRFGVRPQTVETALTRAGLKFHDLSPLPRAKRRPRPRVELPAPPRSVEWLDRAACRDTDLDVFFDERPEGVAAALTWCHSCPVRRQCLASTLAAGDQHGVFGGTTPAQRRRLINRAWAS